MSRSSHARRSRRVFAVACGILLLVTTACDRGAADRTAVPDASSAAAAAPAPAAGAPTDSARPPLPVDSFLPLDEALRRFRAPLGPAPAALRGGEPSREALVRAFVRAVERRDTAALNRLIVSRAEFAWLYYPSSPFVRPPYELDPQMAWFQLRTQSEKGIGRVLERLGGASLGYRGHACPDAPARQGENRVWTGCVVRTSADAAAGERRLFGSIVERGGTFKFVGYGSDF